MILQLHIKYIIWVEINSFTDDLHLAAYEQKPSLSLKVTQKTEITIFPPFNPIFQSQQRKRERLWFYWLILLSILSGRTGSSSMQFVLLLAADVKVSDTLTYIWKFLANIF